MKKYTAHGLLSLPLLMGALSLAEAHVTFVANNAYAGKSYVATLNTFHGCEDANATEYDTVKIEVTIPAGFTAVRPADATFGPASVEKDTNGNVTKLIWTKTAPALTEDANFQQVTFRGTLPNEALTTLTFPTTQTCAGDTTKTWIGADAPKLRVLSVRTPGWNKYTAQQNIDEATLKAFFTDAHIVWSSGAAYSINPEIMKLVTNPLTAIPQGGVYWVKY